MDKNFGSVTDLEMVVWVKTEKELKEGRVVSSFKELLISSMRNSLVGVVS